MTACWQNLLFDRAGVICWKEWDISRPLLSANRCWICIVFWGNWVNSFKSTFLGSSFQLGDRTASGHVYRLAWTNHPLLAVEIPTLQDRVPRECLQRFHTELGWKSTLRWIPLVSPGIVLSSRKPIRNARTILVPSNTWSNWSNAKDPVWIASGFSASQPGNILKRKFQYQLVNC